MEACKLILRLPSEMCREGHNSARIACFQLGKRVQITLRGRIIKFGPKRFEGTQGLRSPSEQQITNRPPMEILHRQSAGRGPRKKPPRGVRGAELAVRTAAFPAR